MDNGGVPQQKMPCDAQRTVPCRCTSAATHQSPQCNANDPWVGSSQGHCTPLAVSLSLFPGDRGTRHGFGGPGRTLGEPPQLRASPKLRCVRSTLPTYKANCPVATLGITFLISFALFILISISFQVSCESSWLLLTWNPGPRMHHALSRLA